MVLSDSFSWVKLIEGSTLCMCIYIYIYIYIYGEMLDFCKSDKMIKSGKVDRPTLTTGSAYYKIWH